MKLETTNVKFPREIRFTGVENAAWGKGTSLGNEVVLAASGRAGDEDCSASC